MISFHDFLVVVGIVGVVAIIAAMAGVGVLRLMARRSVAAMLSVVAVVTVVASLAGVVAIAIAMFISNDDRTVVLTVVVVAGLAGLCVAFVVGRRITSGSRALVRAVRAGESGRYEPPAMVLPADLAALSDQLALSHDRLARAHERERALEASRRELVAWVSHDLRTPLAGLRAMAEALEDEVVADPRTVTQYHSQIRREADRLALMVDDLFELARIHAGALRLSRRRVGLYDLVAEALASADPLARAKGVQLFGRARDGLPVEVDEAEFGRALRNLVVNAIRHTPSDDAVEIVGDVRDGMACVIVSDTCGGIPDEDLPRVFDVAFRGQAARTPDPQQGAGLGLAIARGIVEAHAGKIQVSNAGTGCRFVIQLPLAS